MNGITENGEALPRRGLTTEEYRKAAYAMVDYIIQHNEDVKDTIPTPDVMPGFMRSLIPDEAPEQREEWQKVFKDIDDVIIKGNLEWHAPHMFGFFPSANSYPAMLGDMLSTAISCIGFSWASSPSCTELEMVMMDWLAKALDLPKFYLHEGSEQGGGVIQGSASESTLVTLLAARNRMVRLQLATNPDRSSCEIVNKFVVYTSSLSHSSVEKASKISLVEIRLLEVDDYGSVRGNTLQEAIAKDKIRGKIPIYVCASLGTTSCCTYDNLKEIGPICKDENMWLHVDAAYAGAGLLCPELRYIADGIEHTDSFVVNPQKLMMVNFDCSALWIKDARDLTNAFNMDRPYLKHQNQNKAIDYMDWQLGFGRRFRSIKLWFVMRMVGLEGLRTHVRRAVAEAKYLGLVAKDHRFEILFPVTLGLVCLRFHDKSLSKEELNYFNKQLCDAVIANNKIYITPAFEKGTHFLRVAVGHVNTTEESLLDLWKLIQDCTERQGKIGQCNS